MNKYFKSLAVFTIPLMSQLSGCQTQFTTKPNAPTEASLVSGAAGNGLEVELPIGYIEAFKNLKMAYGHCVAFTGEKDFVFTDNKLEDHLEMATLFARTEGGAYLSKTLVEAVGKDKTRLTLFLPSSYKFAQARLKLDAKRAMGQDPLCNVAKPV